MYTVHSMFAAAADATAHRPFLCVPARSDRPYFPEGIEFTYGDIAFGVDQLRTRYSEAGYGHGHRVCLLLENRPDLIVHWLALNAIGVSVVPINPAYRSAEIEYLLSHAEPVLVVTLHGQRQLEAAVERIGGEIAVLRVDGGDLGRSIAQIPSALRKPPRDDVPTSMSEAALLYTSGTTAQPKGCILTNEYFIVTGRWYLSRGGEATYHVGMERLYSPLPLFHMAGLACTFMAMVLSGGCLILPERFNPRYAWSDIVSCRATVLHYLGVIVAALLGQPETEDERRHALRFSLGVGANPDLRARARARFGIAFIEGWGMTETGRSPFNTTEPRHLELNSIGRSEACFEMKVVDAEDDRVPNGVVGELCVRHSAATPRKGFFSGYLKNPDATEAAWRNGWFHTGDSAWQHDDGAVIFVDRLKHLIRRSGENISAAEVEGVLLSFPLVRQAAVVPAHDPVREEEVAAFVVVDGEADRSAATASEVFRHCAARIAPYKLPAWIKFVDELPMTSTNKIQKHQLLEPKRDPETYPGMLDFRADKTAAIKTANQ
ncbi:AMP-binding protein [Tardiphaga sp. 215_C5_N2_1]|uniref:AMP-binding protein n=1 Tax=Tardiphaga sp. 215_C5_N2_1 TaxID=3240774 RepID=UPI003F8AE7A5